MDNSHTILPVSPRFATFFDSSENLFYSSNGNLLETFQNVNNTLVFVKAFKILDAGIGIEVISVHPKGLLVAGEQNLALFCTKKKKVVSQLSLPSLDRIIAAKSLEDGKVAVLSAHKKLYILKTSAEGELAEDSILKLDDECTIFSGLFIGDTLDALELYTGGILGLIHYYKPQQSPKIVSTFKGHEGMVFDICRFENKLYSVADDRSLRAYDLETTDELGAVYGHESRIRSLTVAPDGRVFTAGDAVCTWKWFDSALELVEKHELSIGKIVHLNFVNGLLLATSMNGAFTAIEAKELQWSRIRIEALDKIVVRAFLKTVDGHYFIVDDHKQLLFVTKDGEIHHFIENQQIRFDSLRLSKSGKFVAAASDKTVFFIEADSRKYCTVGVEEVLGGEFFIDDTLFALTRTGKGVMLTMEEGILTQEEFQLSQGFPIRCGIARDGIYIFGTSGGYVSGYLMSDLTDELFSIKVSSKGEPVMDLTVIDSKVFALTRDGKCAILVSQGESYDLIETFATTETPAAFLSTENGEHYIWGFRGPEFVLCPLRSTHPITTYECGGGNRICNVYPVFSDAKSFTGIRFEHLVKGELKIIAFDVAHVQNVVGPYHKSTIYGIALVNGGRSVVTTGIDTQIILHDIDGHGRLAPKWRSSAHTSSVHAMDAIKLKNGTDLVVTVGGKSEIRIWRVGDDALYPIGLFNSKPDVRYVSVKAKESLGEDDLVYLFATCSISELHVFCFHRTSTYVDKLIAYKNPEPTTFSKVAVSDDLFTIYVAATSGIITALSWEAGTREISYVQSIQAMEPGLSALCAVDLDDQNLSKNVCAIGDESGNFAIVDFETEEVVLKSEHPHYSTITDISFSHSHGQWKLATLSTDCHLVTTEFALTEEGQLKITKTSTSTTGVGDPIAFLPIERENSTDYLIVGQGIELVSP